MTSTVEPVCVAQAADRLVAVVPPMIGGGDMGQCIRDTDWSKTPLGAYATWPQSLRSSLSLVLNAKGIAALYWGPQQWLLYNDAYGAALGDRHPWAFGRPMPEVLTDIAPVLGPQVAAVLRTGEGFSIENLPLVMHRHGRDEDTVWTYSFSPVQGETGGFAGVLLLATEMTEQKAAEQAEKQASTRLETAIRIARLGSYDWHPATGIVEVNDRAREIFALPMTGLVRDVEIFARVAPDELDRVRTEAMTAVDLNFPLDSSDLQSVLDINYDIVHPDGSRRSVASSGTIIEDPNGSRRMVGTFSDITEIKRALADLQVLNATLESRVATLAEERNQLWRLSRSPFVVCDTQGVWLSASPVWTDILGWTETELLGRTSAWMEHPDDHDKTRATAVDVVSGEIMMEFNNRFRDRGGDYRRFSWTAVSENGRLFCVARDVTDEYRQNEILVEQASQLKLFGDIIQASAAPICAFDTEFRLIAFNQAHSDEFFRIFAHRVQIGEIFPDLLPPDQAPVMRGFMARALTGEVYTVTEEFGDPGLVKPYWEVSYSPLRDPDGRILGAFHFARDVTARLRAEDELNTAQDALRQAQKLEAVGQLTGGVAHDFNNLLTVIKSSTDLLKRPDLAEERRARYIGAISDTVDRAAKLTGQLSPSRGGRRSSPRYSPPPTACRA